MYALFIVLNEVEYLTEILRKMREIGVKGATVLESIGAAEVIDNDLYTDSVLASIVNALEIRKKASCVVFSVIRQEELVTTAMDEVQKLWDADTKETKKGIMFVLPVTRAYGGEL